MEKYGHRINIEMRIICLPVDLWDLTWRECRYRIYGTHLNEKIMKSKFNHSYLASISIFEDIMFIQLFIDILIESDRFNNKWQWIINYEVFDLFLNNLSFIHNNYNLNT